MLDEMFQPGVDFTNVDEVALYDSKQGTNFEVKKELAQKLGIKKGDVVIEFGPGTGALSFACAQEGAKVFAVDTSKAMLDYIQMKYKKLKMDNIMCIHSGFLYYEHKGESADFIITEYAFHHLPDFWKAKALLNIYNHLKIGGKFYLRDVVFSFNPEDMEFYIENWIEKFTSSGLWSKKEFELHVSKEFSTYSWIIEGLIENAGFKIISKEYDSDLKTYASYLCEK